MTAKEFDVLFIVLETTYKGKDGMCGGVPSGHLYASLMGMVDLETYQGIISVLKEKGLITESNHLLKPTAKLSALMNKQTPTPTSVNTNN